MVGRLLLSELPQPHEFAGHTVDLRNRHPLLGVDARRLHDTNHWWVAAIVLVPIVGWVWLLV